VGWVDSLNDRLMLFFSAFGMCVLDVDLVLDGAPLTDDNIATV
jgi:hypothetical protein